MARDIQCFVLACSVCAVSKTSNQPSAGLLQPLLVPSRPWSHISLDFVTGLPPSSGNTVVDRFSKAAHFIPLPKLPSGWRFCGGLSDRYCSCVVLWRFSTAWYGTVRYGTVRLSSGRLHFHRSLVPL